MPWDRSIRAAKPTQKSLQMHVWWIMVLILDLRILVLHVHVVPQEIFWQRPQRAASVVLVRPGLHAVQDPSPNTVQTMIAKITYEYPRPRLSRLGHISDQLHVAGGFLQKALSTAQTKPVMHSNHGSITSLCDCFKTRTTCCRTTDINVPILVGIIARAIAIARAR